MADQLIILPSEHDVSDGLRRVLAGRAWGRSVGRLPVADIGDATGGRPRVYYTVQDRGGGARDIPTGGYKFCATGTAV